MIGVQLGLVLSNLFVKWLRPPNLNHTEDAPPARLSFLTAVLIRRLVGLVWVVLAIIGITWTFQVYGCERSVPLYTVCFVLAILLCGIMGLPLLLCACSVPLFMVVFWLFPAALQIVPRRANARTIEHRTKVKKFVSGMVPEDDASCAVCLDPYEIGAELRFLPCGHHYHALCSMKWLQISKVCPTCKQDIEGSPEIELPQPSIAMRPTSAAATGPPLQTDSPPMEPSVFTEPLSDEVEIELLRPPRPHHRERETV